jgi:hypothetical protein
LRCELAFLDFYGETIDDELLSSLVETILPFEAAEA